MSAAEADWSEQVELRDGTRIELRPVLPEDAPRLRALFHRLSPESVYLRFLEARKELTLEQARDFATVNYGTTMAIVAVAEVEDAQRIIGVARYSQDADDPKAGAETAVVVEDEYQGRGLGTILLHRLVDYARDHGVEKLSATVHPTNAQILRFVRRSNLSTQRRFQEGSWQISLRLDRGELGDLKQD